MRGAIVLAMGLAACGTQARWQPSEAMERSARMLRQLDRLEADLHTSSGETTTFADLVERHARSQEAACKITDEHIDDIHRLAAAQEYKAHQKKLGRLRLHSKKAIAQLRTAYSKS